MAEFMYEVYPAVLERWETDANRSETVWAADLGGGTRVIVGRTF